MNEETPEPKKPYRTMTFGPPGARVCPVCSAATERFENTRAVLWYCAPCVWVRTEAQILVLEQLVQRLRMANLDIVVNGTR